MAGHTARLRRRAAAAAAISLGVIGGLLATAQLGTAWGAALMEAPARGVLEARIDPPAPARPAVRPPSPPAPAPWPQAAPLAAFPATPAVTPLGDRLRPARLQPISGRALRAVWTPTAAVTRTPVQSPVQSPAESRGWRAMINGEWGTRVCVGPVRIDVPRDGPIAVRVTEAGCEGRVIALTRLPAPTPPVDEDDASPSRPVLRT